MEGREAHVEFYVDEKGEHRWRVVGANGEVVSASSEGYEAEADARHGFDLTQESTSEGEEDVHA